MIPSIRVANSRGCGGLNFWIGVPEAVLVSRPPMPESIRYRACPESSTRYLPGCTPGRGFVTHQTLIGLPIRSDLGPLQLAGRCLDRGQLGGVVGDRRVGRVQEQERAPHDDRGDQRPDQDRDLLLPGGRADQEAGLEILRGRAAVGRRDADDPAIDSAVRRYSGPTQPSRTKIRQVNSSVAIVIPEIGLDDEPITPVIRELTVTNRNPNRTIIAPPISRPVKSVGIRWDAAIASTSPSEPKMTTAMGRSRSVRATPLSSPRLPDRRSRRLPVTEATIRGRALSMLRMPPAATAPAPM